MSKGAGLGLLLSSEALNFIQALPHGPGFSPLGFPFHTITHAGTHRPGFNTSHFRNYFRSIWPGILGIKANNIKIRMSITNIIKHTAEIILSTIYGVDNIWLKAILPTLVSLLKSEIIINFNILPYGLHRSITNIKISCQY